LSKQNKTKTTCQKQKQNKITNWIPTRKCVCVHIKIEEQLTKEKAELSKQEVLSQAQQGECCQELYWKVPDGNPNT
jgi:hypothetical protein